MFRFPVGQVSSRLVLVKIPQRLSEIRLSQNLALSLQRVSPTRNCNRPIKATKSAKQESQFIYRLSLCKLWHMMTHDDPFIYALKWVSSVIAGSLFCPFFLFCSGRNIFSSDVIQDRVITFKWEKNECLEQHLKFCNCGKLCPTIIPENTGMLSGHVTTCHENIVVLMEKIKFDRNKMVCKRSCKQFNQTILNTYPTSTNRTILPNQSVFSS